MKYYFGKRQSLIDLVLCEAEKMHNPSLICFSFNIPDSTAIKLRKAKEANLISELYLYLENRHKKNLGWQKNIKAAGGFIIHKCIHAKGAILQDEQTNIIILSSNNWKRTSNIEFYIVIEGQEALPLISQTLETLEHNKQY